jgi:acyl-CoA synthetase (AMP-forming)/AMP-acid ligase II/acyl carrier protein
MEDIKNITSIAELIERRAESQPDFVILTYLVDGESEEQPLTYRAFERQAKQVAGFLQEKGLKGERVLLLFPQGLEYMIALFGCFYAGVVAVPAYPPRNNRNMNRIEAIIQDTSARAILADQATVDRIQKMQYEFANQPLFAYEEVIAEQANWTPHTIQGADIAYLQYTSGSTGTPKGVVIRHENVLINAEASRNIYPPDTRVAVNWIPMFHDMGLIYMMSYLIQNAQCYFMSPVSFIQKPFRWMKAVSKYKADYTVAPNFAFDLCCEKISEEQVKELDLSHLRSVLSGSERVQLSTLLNFYRKFKPAGFRIEAFKPGYGLAEATLAVSYVTHDGLPRLTPKSNPGPLTILSEANTQHDAPQDYHVSIGPPVEGCTLRIVAPETQAVLPEGEEGEIWISFPGSIASGYWENESASQETFYNYLEQEEGVRYLRSGDLGFLLDGELYITGRIKDLIIIRGRNYYPIDIEYVVAGAHPALQQNSGAAFYIEENGIEQLAIVQEVRRSQWRSADPDEVIERIRKAVTEEFELAAARIVLIYPMSLPKTSSGKVQRQVAKRQMLAGTLKVMKDWIRPSVHESPTHHPLEAAINSDNLLLWLRQQIAIKTQMPLEEISPESAFNDFPLDSVEGVEIAGALSEQLDFQAEAEAFWSLPDLREIAEYLYQQYQAAKAR